MNDAQTARAPLEAMEDRISPVFLPVVVSFLFAFSLYSARLLCFKKSVENGTERKGKSFFALSFALETVIIADPCALGLATSTAVIVASGVGTGSGCRDGWGARKSCRLESWSDHIQLDGACEVAVASTVGRIHMQVH